ncbi:MAG: ATP-dependent DNA ligase [Thaumarchaeota archaeon]|jgi:DNA ligase-1|nr:ATP-dependent DNA ligase [Candidatus Terraquivivens yellowstonensis]MCL7388128.1 ATP-dependent DNA ligase [Candidatus Terraquivivens yellowstonensis]MCL7392775.1 ATP-dependent DNA ligase [Candidatus Terraquivivens yellowstonensis]MCL7395704.1 ATP-dependent DNA ligase [Candidatus Terraquivivens yellowstonensis]MCL7397570.1 ATP-dependent DNA ligase [Candidatus Terraquivivens yellowstonensis]
MLFSELVEFYERIEATTKRLEMTDILVELFKKTDPEIIDKVVYMTLGELYPPFVGIELGVAEKLALRALKAVTGASEKKIQELYGKLGDIGLTAEKLLLSKAQVTLYTEPLTVERVYSSLEKIARTTGEGAIETKLQILVGILGSAQPKEAKYIMRMVTGTMRLGVADMTILDALAVAYGGSKEVREAFERAYNISSDIGLVAKVAAEGGLEAIKGFKIRVGNPIRPMLAERLSTAEEILEKMGGKGLAEFKYDGERMQIHKRGEEIIIFSRRQENITAQYPDVVNHAKRCIKANEAIVECEAVAVDPETGDMLPFQELMHRRRKYDIEKAIEKYPVSLFFFDALYVDGQDLTSKPLLERRKVLESIIEVNEGVALTESKLVEKPEELEAFFLRAVESGCEGAIVKSVSPESVYKAGARGWLWIKYKRSYVSKMVDTVDLVVVGAFYGKGKRRGKFGALLMAAYNPEEDVFESVCKVGSGFTDEDLAKLPEMLSPYISKDKPPRVDSNMQPDVWLKPAMVLEIIGDEITLSPIHTCCWGRVKEGAGLAIRFPRFTGRFRFDKSPEDATTSSEILSMYERQLKKVAEKPTEGV